MRNNFAKTGANFKAVVSSMKAGISSGSADFLVLGRIWAYRVDVFQSGSCHTLYKRYSEFEELHKQLKKMIVTPEFPPKKVLKFNPKIVEQRRVTLEAYLQGILESETIPRSFLKFLEIHLPRSGSFDSLDVGVSEPHQLHINQWLALQRIHFSKKITEVFCQILYPWEYRIKMSIWPPPLKKMSCRTKSFKFVGREIIHKWTVDEKKKEKWYSGTVLDVVSDTEKFLSNPNLQKDCIDSLTLVHREKFSRYISGLMDKLGYRHGMIKKRQQVYQAYDTKNELYTCVVTGSKGEGTALFLENDFDIMLIRHDVICADNPQDFIHERNIMLFQAEIGEDTPPGYTRLRLISYEGTFDDEVRQCIFTSETESTYISSQFFIESLSNAFKNGISDHFTPRDPQGPSSPFSGSGVASYFKFDAVNSFKCHCPSILNRWVSRPRSHGWPSSDLIHEVSLKDGHVVPVGSKGSENMYREWRICYSLAELHLIRNFNETQLKVYIFLKKICKSVLNPVCKEMTSYIMKNVVFWICEAKGLRLFGHNHLLDRLIDSIQYLRACIIKGNLPSYMIPERNLLAGRIDIQQRHRLIAVLGDLLHEGGRMILRCDRICDNMLVMYREPAMFKEFCEKRDQLEVGVLNFCYSKDGIQGLMTEENLDFEFQQLLYERQLNVLFSSIETGEQGEDVQTVFTAILS